MEIFERRKVFGLISVGCDLQLTASEMEVILRSQVPDNLLRRFRINEDGDGTLSISHSLKDFYLMDFVISKVKNAGYTVNYV